MTTKEKLKLLCTNRSTEPQQFVRRDRPCLHVGYRRSRRLGDWWVGFIREDLALPNTRKSVPTAVSRREQRHGGFIDDALNHLPSPNSSARRSIEINGGPKC